MAAFTSPGHLCLKCKKVDISVDDTYCASCSNSLAPTPTPSSKQDCYCACHSSVASNAYCEHCKGDNEVGRAHGFAPSSKQGESNE